LHSRSCGRAFQRVDVTLDDDFPATDLENLLHPKAGAARVRRR